MTEKKNQQPDTLEKKKRMLNELRENLGIITISAQKAKISRDTHYDWMGKDKKYKEQVEAILERQRDDVEDRLLKAIQKDSIPGIIFYLKNKHPNYKPKQVISFEHEKIDKHLDKIANILDGK